MPGRQRSHFPPVGARWKDFCRNGSGSIPPRVSDNPVTCLSHVSSAPAVRRDGNVFSDSVFSFQDPSGSGAMLNRGAVPPRIAGGLYGTSGPLPVRCPGGTREISRWRKPPVRSRNRLWPRQGPRQTEVPTPLPGLNPILVAGSGGLRHRLLWLRFCQVDVRELSTSWHGFL